MDWKSRIVQLTEIHTVGRWFPHARLKHQEILNQQKMIAAQGERDLQAIKDGRASIIVNSDGQYAVMENAPSALAIDGGALPMHEPVRELRRLTNRLSIAHKAYDHVGEGEFDGNENDDADYFDRAFEYAGDASEADVQDLWARLISGKVRSPSAYSLRFVEFLHGIDSRDVQRIRNLSVYIVGEEYIPKLFQEIPANPIGIEDLSFLQEVGLIAGFPGIGGLSIEIKVSPEERPHIYLGDNKILALISEKEKSIEFECYPISSLWQQFIRIDSDRPFSVEMGEYLGRFLSEKHKIKVKMAEVSSYVRGKTLRGKLLKEL